MLRLVIIAAILQLSISMKNGKPPNIILILADDVGYGDLASYGHPTQEFGPIDEIAGRGMRFTQAYSADSVCSPSRASLLTARFPIRTGAWGETTRIWLPTSSRGLPLWEITIAEALKEQGYTTGMVGKWHLGTNRFSHDDFFYFPGNQGFDFVGHVLPFGGAYPCQGIGRYEMMPTFCALCYGNKIVQQPYNLQNLSVNFVNDTLTFIRNNKDGPFFFYYAETHNHVPMYSSRGFEDSSERGPYGDGMNELSWVVQSVVQEVHSLGIENDTLVAFMSDNGPQLEYCQDGGDPGIFRGGKTNSYEGGYRVPMISYWPGVIQPGVSNEIFSAVDLLPSFVDLAGGQLPDDRAYDGISNVNALLGKGPSTRDFVLFYNRDVLFAVRFGDYKVHFLTQDDESSQYFGKLCHPFVYPSDPHFYCDEKDLAFSCVKEHDPPLIFNLLSDPTESYPLDPSIHQDLLKQVQNLINNHKGTIVRMDPLMDANSDETTPCCDTATGCICNWP